VLHFNFLSTITRLYHHDVNATPSGYNIAIIMLDMLYIMLSCQLTLTDALPMNYGWHGGGGGTYVLTVSRVYVPSVYDWDDSANPCMGWHRPIIRQDGHRVTPRDRVLLGLQLKLTQGLSYAKSGIYDHKPARPTCRTSQTGVLGVYDNVNHSDRCVQSV
jgi:hypothetical protein